VFSPCASGKEEIKIEFATLEKNENAVFTHCLKAFCFSAKKENEA